jgi:hypothetical protein
MKEHVRSLMISRIGEKWLEWVDEPLSPEHILESITLYWLTETFPRSIYTYRQVSNSETFYLDVVRRSNNFSELSSSAYSSDQRPSLVHS